MGHKTCIHGKKTYYCADCGGKGICEHGTRKSQCKYCLGSSICQHRRRKSQCKQCGGSSFCIHGKYKTHCRECNERGFCIHGKNPYYCAGCGGKGICEHGKKIYYCADCGGKGICEHRRRKSECKQCRGSSFCQHGKIKSNCKKCGGSTFCVHGKQKPYCIDCGGRLLCKTPLCEIIPGNKKYKGYCMRCFVHLFPELKNARNYKTKEQNVVDKVKIAFPDVSWFCDKTVQDGCSRKRPDMLLDMGSHAIIVEVDENQHVNYDCSCENKRLMELSQDVDHRPIVFIRFNPDKYFDKDGNKVDSCWEETKQGVLRVAPKKQQEWEHRLECLVEQIQYWTENETNKTVEVVELFYDAN